LAAPRRGGHGDGETDLKGAHLTVAVAGNPNVGKTSLFNVLTGSRHEVGNYPGVTVERRVGHLASRFDGHAMQVVDLPGTYSLTATSEDEAVAFRALTGADEAPPDVILLVLDASNLARNLYLALQVLELGLPVVVALNMVDLAKQAGVTIDPEALEAALGVPVVPTVARIGEGLDALIKVLDALVIPSERASARLIPPAAKHEALRAS